MENIYEIISACPDGLIVVFLAVLYLLVLFIMQYRHVIGYILLSLTSIKVLPFLILLVIVLTNVK